MTALIEMQLRSMGLMVCAGLAAGVVYEFFSQLQRRLGKGHAWSKGLLRLFSLGLIGYSTSVFLYVSQYGKISLPAFACFFAGVGLWRKLIFTEDTGRLYGKEGEQTAGIRKE